MVSLIEGERVVQVADLAPQERRMLRRAKAKFAQSHHPYSKSEHYVSSVVLVAVDSNRVRVQCMRKYRGEAPKWCMCGRWGCYYNILARTGSTSASNLRCRSIW